jgi:hypothetical protein
MPGERTATGTAFCAILRVSLVSFAAMTLCVASQRVFIVVSMYFVIDSVRKLLDTPLYSNSLVNSYIPIDQCSVCRRDAT